MDQIKLELEILRTANEYINRFLNPDLSGCDELVDSMIKVNIFYLHGMALVEQHLHAHLEYGRAETYLESLTKTAEIKKIQKDKDLAYEYLKKSGELN